MPDPTHILLKIDDAGYEVGATVMPSGIVVEAIHRQTGERFTVTSDDAYAAAVELARIVEIDSE